MKIIKEFSYMYGNSVLDGGCRYIILKKTEELSKMTPRELIDKLGYTYYYNGPGNLYMDTGYAIFRRNYIIIRQNWGYDIQSNSMVESKEFKKEIDINKAKVVKVVKVDSDSLEFDNGIILTSNHNTECCESHYLSLSDLTLDDFDDLKFDLTSDFFERIPGYGIALKPLFGHPVRIPGYGVNNGWYSFELDLVLSDKNGILKVFDVSECQEIKDDY